MGFYYHSGSFLNRESKQLERGLTAFYTTTDVQILPKFHAFFQLDISEDNVSKLKHYVGGGLRYEIARKDKTDELGFAIAHVAVNQDALNESKGILRENAFELNYKRKISEQIQIQPYIHLIAMEELANKNTNTFILAIRAYVQF